MAVVYITEYAAQAADAANRLAPMPKEPAVTTQTVAIGVEAKSSAFNTLTRMIRVHTDAVCSVLVGTSPTATTSSPRMAADTTEYFGVEPGQQISVISNT